MQKLHRVTEYPLVERQVAENIVLSIPDLKLWTSVSFPLGKKYSDVFKEVQNKKIELINKAILKLRQIQVSGKHHPEPGKIRQSISTIKEKEFTPREVAEILGTTKMTITRHCHSGKIKATRTLGGHWRISAEELEKQKSKLDSQPSP